MGLAGARNSAVTGLQAQSTSISISADNIANAATPGYKAVKGQFSSLVTNAGTSTGFSSGGVSVRAQTLVETQGLVEATGRLTDLAISGQGFFAVQDDSGTLLLTRAGSFDINNKGELVNSAGFTLLGWPLDNDGRRPGETGNTNTTAAESTNSLVAVDINAASGTAAATTGIEVGMNLNAGQGTFQGAALNIVPASTANSTISEDDIVVPTSTMQEGDALTLESNSNSTTFTYGGFSTSSDLSEDAVFGASTASTTFTTDSTLANGDRFTITTISSGTATFTFQQSAPDTASGEFNSLDSLATAIGLTTGLTARVSGTTLYVSSIDANEAITFADVASSNLHKELGFSNESTGTNRWNTISGLAALANAANTQLGAVINNPTSGATIDIFSADPLLELLVTKEFDSVTVDLTSDENGNLSQNGLIVPYNGSGIVPEITTGGAAGASTVSFSDGTNTGTFTYGGVGQTDQVSTLNTIFGASTASGGSLADTTDLFVNGTGGLDDGDTITFREAGANTVVVTYNNVATSALAAGEFNSLITLAAAIDANANFVSRVENGTLYVASQNSADNAVDISAAAGITGAQMAAAFGGDFVDGGGNTATIVAAQNTGVNGNRFYSLAQLSTLVDAVTNFSATTPSGTNANFAITTDDGTQITIAGANNTELLSDLGLTAGDVGDGFFAELGIDGVVAAGAEDATVLVTYDPTDPDKNMAGGDVDPHFSRNIRVFDSLGTGHDFRLSFLKTGSNEWGVEFYALDPTEISGSADGQVVSGTLTFNGDGSLKSVSNSLTSNTEITWTTGAVDSTIEFDLGTAGSPAGTSNATVIGLTDGVRQFDSAFNVEFINQNGVAAGQFRGITVTEDGTVNANFSNGEIKPIFQLPILLVANQNALTSKSGNVFSITQASGDVNLKEAGQGGAGVIIPGALEGSTADIAEELTRTIGIQSNYNANATLISTVRDMEEELNRRL